MTWNKKKIGGFVERVQYSQGAEGDQRMNFELKRLAYPQLRKKLNER